MQTMLHALCEIRGVLDGAEFQRKPRRIKGRLFVTEARLENLTLLQSNGKIERILIGDSHSSHLPDVVGHVVTLHLIMDGICYYEDIHDLVSQEIEEPESYYVHGIGSIIASVSSGDCGHEAIQSYRQMLKARALLRATADYPTIGKVVFLTPEKLEIPLHYSEPSIPPLTHLDDLRGQLEKEDGKNPADLDQRLVLFRKSLREYLKGHPPEERFRLFLRNFETIYDSYSRDYQLWVGNTFCELEKSFEEKRLKFVADLNATLTGVQASLLAVPIAAIILVDKYDYLNPTKDFLLASGVLAISVVAVRLLQNQEATLNATRKAIDSTKEDFEKKHTKRREEFKTRLQNLDDQEEQVRRLLFFIRNTIILIAIAGFAGWLFALAQSR